MGDCFSSIVQAKHVLGLLVQRGVVSLWPSITAYSDSESCNEKALASTLTQPVHLPVSSDLPLTSAAAIDVECCENETVVQLDSTDTFPTSGVPRRSAENSAMHERRMTSCWCYLGLSELSLQQV
ncbi:uncharacterized [Tachysurus ichikawai]